MADHFAGVQEYMALDRLYDLRASGDWDLVVLDTPPAQNASDFFTAPQRVSALFDERIMRWFVPAEAAERNLLKRVFNPGAVVLKLLALIGGQQFIDELAGFFDAIRIVRAAFKERGDAVQGILRESSTRYVVVASPDPRRVLEALTFHGRMGEMGLDVARFVLNRSHHRFRPDDVDSLLPALSRMTAGAVGGVDPAIVSRADKVGARVVSFYRELVHLADRDRAGIAQLTARVSHDRVRLVPVFGRDIHTAAELLQLARFVVA
jgi:anion-transporting  ArsA/GET3 family ATPase